MFMIFLKLDEISDIFNLHPESNHLHILRLRIPNR